MILFSSTKHFGHSLFTFPSKAKFEKTCWISFRPMKNNFSSCAQDRIHRLHENVLSIIGKGDAVLNQNDTHRPFALFNKFPEVF